MVIFPFLKEVKKVEGALLSEKVIDPESSPLLYQVQTLSSRCLDFFISWFLCFWSLLGWFEEFGRFKDLFF